MTEEAANLLAEVTRRPAPAVQGESVVTVGRMVHYVPVHTSLCWAAIVTQVHSATCIDVTAFAPTGLLWPARVLHVGDGPRPGYDPGTWHWPERA